MSLSELWLLAPALALSVGIIILLLQASWRRHQSLPQWISIVTILLSICLLLIYYPQGDSTITILFTLEPAAAFFSLLILLASLSVTILQYQYMGNNCNEVSEEFYILLLLATLGGMLLTMASHVGSILLCVELMGLSILALLAYNRERKQSLEATFKYLILSGAATSLLILGFALLYADSGSLLLNDIFAVNISTSGKLGLVMVMAALAVKLSLAPLHIWTPDVYEGAPANSTLLLTTVSKAAVFALLLKLMQIIPDGFVADLTTMLSWVAVASMLLGNWLALQQSSIKRLMAYSAIAHMGYILVSGIIAMQSSRAFVVEGAGYYLAAYLIASIIIFAVISRISSFDQLKDVDNLTDIRGLFWSNPWLAIAMTLAFLSLAGMPITVGFIGKFYLLTMAIELNAWWLVSAMIIGSAVAIYYYLRVIFSLFAPRQSHLQIPPHNLTTNTWIAAITLSLLLLGILPGILGDNLPILLASQ